jgi:hypothetical protein
VRRKETGDSRRGTLADPIYLQLATGQNRRIEISSFQEVSGLLISVQTGQLNIWWGDYSGAQLPAVAQFHFYPTGQSLEMDLPIGLGCFTVAAAGAFSLIACITLVN